jgi:trimethylamine:corrinoid methyltransferase-like protein
MKTQKKEERCGLRERRRKKKGSPLKGTNLKRLVKPLLNTRSIPESELRRVKAMCNVVLAVVP